MRPKLNYGLQIIFIMVENIINHTQHTLSIMKDGDVIVLNVFVQER